MLSTIHNTIVGCCMNNVKTNCGCEVRALRSMAVIKQSLYCSFQEPPKGCAGLGGSASPSQRLATRLASQNYGNAPG